jgi:hypothetical protein
MWCVLLVTNPSDLPFTTLPNALLTLIFFPSFLSQVSTLTLLLLAWKRLTDALVGRRASAKGLARWRERTTAERMT